MQLHAGTGSGVDEAAEADGAGDVTERVCDASSSTPPTATSAPRTTEVAGSQHTMDTMNGAAAAAAALHVPGAAEGGASASSALETSTCAQARVTQGSALPCTAMLRMYVSEGEDNWVSCPLLPEVSSRASKHKPFKRVERSGTWIKQHFMQYHPHELRLVQSAVDERRFSGEYREHAAQAWVQERIAQQPADERGRRRLAAQRSGLAHFVVPSVSQPGDRAAQLQAQTGRAAYLREMAGNQWWRVLLLRWAAVHSVSMEALSSPLLHEVLQQYVKQEQWHSRRQLGRQVHDFSDAFVSELTQHVAYEHVIAVTMDEFTSITERKLLGVTAHWLDAEFTVRMLAIDLVDVTDNADQHHLKQALEGALEDRFGPSVSLSAVVADNASSVQAAARALTKDKEDVVPCVAHSMQLLIYDGVKACDALQHQLDSVAAVMNRLSRSPRLLNELHVRREAAGRRRLMPVLRNATRWTSTLRMVERFLQLHDDLLALFDEWDDMARLRSPYDLRKYVELVTPFEAATHEVSGVKRTIADVPAIVARLRQHLDKYGVLRESPITTFLQGLVNNFNRRLLLPYVCTQSDGVWHARLPLLCSLLHPAYAELDYLEVLLRPFHLDSSRSGEEHADVEDDILAILRDGVRRIKEHLELYKLVASQAPGLASGSRHAQLAQHRTSSPADAALHGWFHQLPTGSTMRDGNIVSDMDCLAYWRDHCHQHPALARLARILLAIPPTQTQSERLFSAVGQLHNETRARMGPTLLRSLLVMQSMPRDVAGMRMVREHLLSGIALPGFQRIDSVSPVLKEDEDNLE